MAAVRPLKTVVPFAAISGVVVLVTLGLARSVWLPNLHNGLLAIAFTLVGAYVLHQRPGQREGSLFLLTGSVEGVMFFGRQVGHTAATVADRWWAWLGVWPLAVALGLTTISVICFPDGHLPSRRWRWVVGAVLVLACSASLTSALWPVEYASAGVTIPHPLGTLAPPAIATGWALLAHPIYAGLQLLWVVAVVLRWRSADQAARRQLSWIVAASVVSVCALLLGLLLGGTPIPGLLAAAAVPIAAGWAIVHGEHVTAYSALTWLSRQGAQGELPAGIARAAAAALNASSAALWTGSDARLRCIGEWPEGTGLGRATTLSELELAGHARPIEQQGRVVGALSVRRASSDELTVPERRLFADLAAQAALVIAHVTLNATRPERAVGRLQHLSRRERQVLDLMALGRSNAAISAELHLSIKTVEPTVSTIFNKLGLPADTDSNRRVLAVLTYLQGRP